MLEHVVEKNTLHRGRVERDRTIAARQLAAIPFARRRVVPVGDVEGGVEVDISQDRAEEAVVQTLRPLVEPKLAPSSLLLGVELAVKCEITY